MSELAHQLRERAAQAHADLAAAEEGGDTYLADVHRAELDSLSRLATEHGLRIPGLGAPAKD